MDNDRTKKFHKGFQQIQKSFNDKPMARFKVKPKTKLQQTLKTEDIFQNNDFYGLDGFVPKQIYSGTNLDEALKVEEYNSQTPLNRENNNYSDDLRLPQFQGQIARDSNNASSKGQFYMTQIINQTNIEDISNIYSSQNIKNVKSNKGSSYKNKKKLQTKSSLAKSYQKMSPMLTNKNPVSRYAEKNISKRAQLNQSAQMVNQSKEQLNSTAPINFSQLHGVLQPTVTQEINRKSMQMLKHIGSKDSWKDMTGSYPALPNEGNKTSVGQSVKSSMSPNKYNKIGQIHSNYMVDGIQKKNNKQTFNDDKKCPQKYFLNLTLQKLIQDQKQQTQKSQLMDQKIGVYQDLRKSAVTTQQHPEERVNYSLGVQRRLHKNENLNNKQGQNIQQIHQNNIKIMNNYNPQILSKIENQGAKTQFNNTMVITDLGQINENIQKENSQKRSIANHKKKEDLNQSQFRKHSQVSTTSKTHNSVIKKKGRGMQKNSNAGIDSKHGNKSHQRQSSIEHAIVNDKDLVKKILNICNGNTEIYNTHINTIFNNSQIPSQQRALSIQNHSKHKANQQLNEYLIQKTTEKVEQRQQKSNNLSEPRQQYVNKTYIKTSENYPSGSENMIPTFQIQQCKTNSNSQLGQRQQNKKKELNQLINNFNLGFQKEIKELQNKTQPLPKSILEMAKAEMAQEESGLSVGIKRGSTGSSKNKSRSRAKSNLAKQKQQDEKKTAQQEKEELIVKPKIGKKDPDIAYKNDISPQKCTQDLLQQNKIIFCESILDSECLDEDSEIKKLDRFVLGKQIGQGAYAIVRVALNKEDNQKYAIKIYDKSKLTDINRQKSVRREIKLLQKMNHPNIVKIFEAFETESNVYLVMEYVNGGSLHSFLKSKSDKRLEEWEAKKLFKQVLTALQYCHRKSIAHRDIKLENILLDENNNVKLIDFGFSTCIPNDKKIKMFCGTPSYMAPEIVAKIEYTGPPADVWASAVLLYALMNGCFPFRGATDKELYRRIQRGTFVMHNEEASDLFLNFLIKMFNVEADSRPTVDELLDDEWFQKDGEIINHEQKIALEKKQFKAKIMAKLNLSKNKNTIQNHQKEEELKQKLIKSQNNSQQENGDYGMTQSNQNKKLNQEAYQAYYNTNGYNNYPQTNQIPQNPYYNNFFQSNQNNMQVQPNYYPGIHQNQFYQKNSPSKQNQHQLNFPLNFPNTYQNPMGTPQVFSSPQGFQCNGGMINNNFNIINNITQVISPCSQSPQNQMQQDEKKENKKKEFCFDEEIINSITQMGYQKSQILSDLENDSSNNISNIYNKLKEEKMSKTQMRPVSMQPYGRDSNKRHTGAIFPQFVPSLPESNYANPVPNFQTAQGPIKLVKLNEKKEKRVEDQESSFNISPQTKQLLASITSQ